MKQIYLSNSFLFKTLRTIAQQFKRLSLGSDCSTSIQGVHGVTEDLNRGSSKILRQLYSLNFIGFSLINKTKERLLMKGNTEETDLTRKPLHLKSCWTCWGYLTEVMILYKLLIWNKSRIQTARRHQVLLKLYISPFLFSCSLKGGRDC